MFESHLSLVVTWAFEDESLHRDSVKKFLEFPKGTLNRPRFVCDFVTEVINGNVRYEFSFIIFQCITLESKLFPFASLHVYCPNLFCEFLIRIL
jgi:hypothetical protein